MECDIYIYSSFIAPCQTLRVTFKNEVLLKQEEQQGRYERSTDINGRPSWIHTNNLQAIWYNPSLKRWAIGRLSDIGTEIRGISGYLRDAPTLPYETTSWEFWTDRTFDEDTIDENADFGLVFVWGEILFTYIIFAYHWTF